MFDMPLDYIRFDQELEHRQPAQTALSGGRYHYLVQTDQYGMTLMHWNTLLFEEVYGKVLWQRNN